MMCIDNGISMKKILFVVLTLCCAIVAGAQEKGEKYLGVGLCLNAGSKTTESKVGGYIQSETVPNNFELGMGAEFGYFVSNNIRVALSLNYSHENSPTSKTSEGTWLKEKANLFGINPNVAYYKRIGDSFYYTPEIGGTVEFGKYSDPINANKYASYNCSGWSIYANLLSFEYRFSGKFALGVSYGSLSYSKADVKEESYVLLGIGAFRFNLSSGSLNARFYL